MTPASKAHLAKLKAEMTQTIEAVKKAETRWQLAECWNTHAIRVSLRAAKEADNAREVERKSADRRNYALAEVFVAKDNAARAKQAYEAALAASAQATEGAK